MGLSRAERKRREEAVYQEATRKHFPEFKWLYLDLYDRAKSAAARKSRRDSELKRVRSPRALVQGSLKSRLSTLISRHDEWDPVHVRRWLTEKLWARELDAFEILYAAERKRTARFVRETPNAIALEPDQGVSHRRALKAFLKRQQGF